MSTLPTSRGASFTCARRITGVGADTVLLYPRWLPGHHAPTGPIDRVAGLRVTAQGRPLNWARDPVDVYAFHVHAGPGVHELDVEFDYLSPTSPKVGEATMSSELMFIDWDSVLLYPSGYFARQIPVSATLRLPAGWQSATALETASEQRRADAATSAPTSRR